ncbi:MAG: DUF6602 domain-containing protein [Candidatus Nitrotoga sp.]
MSQIDLKEVFLSLQDELETRLQVGRAAIRHPGTKGEASELNWRDLLSAYLPQRYCVSKAFVVDSEDQCSDQIDIVIHDRQYSPLLFNHAGAIYVPAESVYCVLEVKQEINRQNLDYACDKAASVRTLKRTSVSIQHAGGEYAARKPFEILAGVLALEGGANLGELLKRELTGKNSLQRLEIGCAVRSGGFDIGYADNGDINRLEVNTGNSALVFFLMRLIHRLRSLATAPAMDFAQYEKFL